MLSLRLTIKATIVLLYLSTFSLIVEASITSSIRVNGDKYYRPAAQSQERYADRTTAIEDHLANWSFCGGVNSVFSQCTVIEGTVSESYTYSNNNPEPRYGSAGFHYTAIVYEGTEHERPTSFTSGSISIGFYSKYVCPETHPFIDSFYTNIPLNTNDDHQPQTCTDIQPICDCDQNFDVNQCIARTPDYSGGEQGSSEDILYSISDANNQGLKCGLAEIASTCDGDSGQGPIPWVGNPVNCTTGQKRQTERDYSSSVGAINFTRTYASTPVLEDFLKQDYNQQGLAFPQNVQWNSNYKSNVSNHQWFVEGLPFLNVNSNNNGYVTSRLNMPSGNSLTFVRNSSTSTWSGSKVRDGQLQEQGQGYQYTSQAGTVYQFDASGRLISKAFRNGQTQTISYPSASEAVLTDNFGRTAQYTYKDIAVTNKITKRVVTKFVDPAGNEYHYQHNNKGYLTKVSYPDTTPDSLTDNPFRFYQYSNRGSNHVLTSIYDEHKHTRAYYEYDDKNRATSSKHERDVMKTTISYSDSPVDGVSTVRSYRDATNYSEMVYKHEIQNGVNKLNKLTQSACPGCVVGESNYSYDANGYLSQKISPDGGITNYQYTPNGYLQSITEAVGTAKERSFNIVWNASLNKPLSIDEPDRFTTYSYDSGGNRTSQNVMDKATNEVRSVTYTYNSVGQVLAVDGPRTDVADVTTYEYDTSGNLIKVTNALGQTTNITAHDAHGKPLSVTDPNGTVTSMTYHPRGWLTSLTTDGDTTHYDYDKGGQLTQVTMANGIQLNYKYDAAHRLVEISDAQSNRITYKLDNFGGRTRTDIRDQYGSIKSYTTQVFNDLGQLKQTLGANNQTNRFDYDAEGKPTQSTDPLNNSSSQTYDALDRLTKSIDPDLAETNFDYDVQNRLTSVTDATGKTTSYVYNAFGEVTSQTSPDTGTTSFTYDKAGNVLTRTDARNIAAIYSYDVLNRPLAIDYSGSDEDVSFVYDEAINSKGIPNAGIGRLTRINDQSGSTEYRYDTKGQLVDVIKILNSVEFITRYQYDAAGLVIQVTYPSGRVVDYSRNNLGQITQMTTTANGVTQTVASDIRYLPFGPMTRLTYGNGKVLNQKFDADYRLTNKTVAGVTDLSYTYTARNNISAITDSSDATKNQSFQYDALARLTDANGRYGTQNYSFDAIGNRLSKTQDGATEDYQYDIASHQLLNVGTTALTYDAIGNTLTKDYLNFTYNKAGRLSTAFTIGMNANYLYNAQGERVSKTIIESASTNTTLYHYDSAGQLIAQTDEYGVVQQEYLYLDGVRIATIEKAPQPNSLILSTSAYATSQDDASTGFVQIEDEGKTLHMKGNRWQKMYFPYQVTANTVLEFDFISIQKGESQAIGLNDAETYNTRRTFELFGTQSWALTDFKDYLVEGDVKNYQIPVGQYFTGNMTFLTFVNDDDVSNPQSESKFKNIKLYENTPVSNDEYFIYYTHTDHLGSPIALTDQSGYLQWKGSYDPYGKVTVEVNNLTQDIRFPGQLLDQETGMHYNYFRDYDPEIGRYLQSDPIGLNGGINTYGYVGGNPVNTIDPYGLVGTTVDKYCLKYPAACGPQGVTAATIGTGLTIIALTPEQGNHIAQFCREVFDVWSGLSLLPPAALPFGADPVFAEESLGDDTPAVEESDHSKGRGEEAKTDKDRQVGDPNKVVGRGRKFTDTETGNTVHVDGDRVVVTDSNGVRVTRFRNTRRNTRDRIRSGRWVPKP